VKRQTYILVVIGVVLFIAGGAIAFVSAASGNKTKTPAATVAAINTPVVVAKANIPAGTTGQEMVSQGLVAISSIPQKQYVATDLTTVSQLNDEVLNAAVTKGHAVSSNLLIPSTTAVTLPQGMDAITVTTTGAEGLAGYLQPGSRVDVYANITKLSTVPASAAATVPVPCTELAMTNIEVIDVSTTAPSLSAHAASASRDVPGSETLLLAVTPDQAQTVTFLTQNETLSVVQTQKGTLPPIIGACKGTGQYTDAP
jgi:Flp pilus assembly protein CpaB